MIRQMDTENWLMLMETLMLDSGWMTKLMVKEYTIILMGRYTMDSGLRISSMELEKKHGLMEHTIKEIIKMERKMEKGS